jgi:LmbE family N-acetylglucosaminyl deacetylase
MRYVERLAQRSAMQSLQRKNMSRSFRRILLVLSIVLGICCLLTSAIRAASEIPAGVEANELPVDLDRGAAGLARCLAELRTRASILMVTAHPDDEDGGLLAYQTRGLGARGILLTLNRGEGGQNAMTTDFYDALGVIRTQELLAADRYYGVDQYWTSVIDYGFSKTREEALQKWGYDRVLGEVVRVVRMTRPLVITSVFAGAPTDGHGNHQVAGQMAQEAFVAAGDPNRFPEQIREGLRPWSPLKVYNRVPFFEPTKEGIYDYATDKYVPVRFFDYVNQKWIDHTPEATVSVPEGKQDAAVGLTFLQMGREGLGQQKSQNGGVTIPPPGPRMAPYHRYGSRVPAGPQENSVYDGIDVSLAGISTLAGRAAPFLKDGLAQISSLLDRAIAGYRPGAPAAIASTLVQGLNATRALIEKVHQSDLPDQGKNDVLFELGNKERQFEKALTLSLQLYFDASVAPEKEPTGPALIFGGPPTTFTVAIPGMSFGVKTRVLNSGPEPVRIETLQLAATDGKDWTIQSTGSPAAVLAPDKETEVKFAVKAAEDATLTRPYYSRPDQEQPYYDLSDPRYENLSVAPYPLFATARIQYQGADIAIRKYVQARTHVDGIGTVANPLLMGPPISVQVSPGAGAVPLKSRSFAFSCTLHSNVKGAAKGVLRLSLPEGWAATPAEYPYAMQHDGEMQSVTFRVTAPDIHEQGYTIKAVAEYAGKKYEEGYRMVGYPGIRSYPYYRPATYKAVGVDVQTAPGLHVGFIPGTGDEVPGAFQNLEIPVRTLSPAELANVNFGDFDAIILGVRAYSANPDLRAAKDRLLDYVKSGGVLIVQYNTQEFDLGPYSFSLGSNPAKVVDEGSAVKLLDPSSPVFTWPNKLSASDFSGWEEERGHGFMQKWDPHYQALVETHDPEQTPQMGGLLLARYGKGFYVYDAFALYRQLPSGVPGAYRILANLVSLGKNPNWK